MGRVKSDLTGQGPPSVEFWIIEAQLGYNIWHGLETVRLRRAEMATNDTKMGWNWDSNRGKHKYIVKYWRRHGFLLKVQNDRF